MSKEGGSSMFNKFIKVSLLSIVATLTIGSFLENFNSNAYGVSLKEETANEKRLLQPSENYDINAVDSEKSFDV